MNPAPTANHPKSMTRREAMLQLLRLGGAATATGGAAVWLSSRSVRPTPELPAQVRRDHRVSRDPKFPQMAVVQGGEPRELAQRALNALGGMGRFVSRNDVVVIKPNIAWDRTPEQAANTNADFVAEIVRQCRQAGAKRVIVTDCSCNEARRCFHRSGIQAAALAAGAEVILPDPDGYRILLRNGPTGGSLEDVALKQTVIASSDPVALDAWVAKAWWNPEPQQLPYLGMAAARGLGTLDFEKLPIFVAENSNQSQRQGLSIKPARTKQAAETLLRA
jgi:uncharacterized protein (DUF362 family)